MTRRDRIYSPEHQALKRDTKALIKAAGGVESAGEFCRTGKSALSDYSVINAEAFAPIDVVADLEAVTRGTEGWPIVTRRLARAAGCSVVVLPEATAVEGDWLAELGDLASDNAKLSKDLCQALSGGITACKARELDLIGDCDALIDLVVNIRARLEKLA